MSKDPMTYYRGQIAAYTDAIRMCDFKANVAVIYGAFTIGPILGFSKSFPKFLPLPVVLSIFALLPADARARAAAVCLAWRHALTVGPSVEFSTERM